MRKQFLAALLSLTFAGMAIMPSASAASTELQDQATVKVPYATIIVNDNGSFPTQVNNPVALPPEQVQKPQPGNKDKQPKHKFKKHKKQTHPKAHKPGNRKPLFNKTKPATPQRPGINNPTPTTPQRPGINKPRPTNPQRPGINKPKPTTPQRPTTPAKNRTKVHGAHWCYGACSLHDAGLHNAPRTQKHWCDGYR